MGSPIRILQVFGGLNRGGSETAIMTIYRNIDREKVQFDFVVHTEDVGDYEDEILSLGGNIYRFPKYNLKNHYNYVKKWSNFFEEKKQYKIIHGHFFTISSVYFSVAKKYGVKCIAHSHISHINGLRGILVRMFTYPLRYSADYLFACSEKAGLWLYGNKAIKKDKFHIVNNAINASEFTFDENTRKEVRKKLDLDDKFVIGHIGRFTEQKNHTFLIEIFKEVQRENKDSVLLLIGEGKLENEIAKKVSEYGLDKNVIFTGVRSDIPELMQGMDIFVFPSLYEGLGIVAIEAQAAGLPCIVADTIPDEAFITDLITRVPLKNDAKSWSKIILAKQNNIREKTYERVVQSGYDILDVARKMEKFYLDNYN